MHVCEETALPTTIIGNAIGDFLFCLVKTHESIVTVPCWSSLSEGKISISHRLWEL
jgi:hypothetical protein